MTLALYTLAAIGAVTVTRVLFRETRWSWKNRNAKRTPFLGLPWGPG